MAALQHLNRVFETWNKRCWHRVAVSPRQGTRDIAVSPVILWPLDNIICYPNVIYSESYYIRRILRITIRIYTIN